MTQLAQVGLGGGIIPALLILGIVFTVIYGIGIYLIHKELTSKAPQKKIIFMVLGCVLFALPFFDYNQEKEKFQILINLNDPTDYAQIPKESRWFPMGNYELTAIEGAVTTEILLPNGQKIKGEFRSVFIDRDQDGIFRVRAVSLESFTPEQSIKHLDKQIDWFSRMKHEDGKTIELRSELVDWFNSWTYSSGSRKGIWARSGRETLICAYSALSGPDHGFRFEYTYEIDRPKERIKNKYPQNQSVLTTPEAAPPTS